ncbi:50S ribosomal protein L25/general stress protein Ctc [Elioraea sp.]|uniref:50S ribosomal protein L25/general stress protein Ctc n=1 Tax=Elioraea sp. TaxID=2185103 RepID=UPI0025C5B03F|nr:50S ribosomal protein L25/general stress protein Ctc [Elioraea sp.]
MVEVVTIEAVARERAGKGAARATRREGLVPAVIYGAKQAPRLAALDPRTVMRELHKAGWRSRLYDVVVGETTERALLREVQFHPVTDRPEHVDFQRLAAGQEIRVGVEVVFLNELASPGLKAGGVLNVVRHEVEVYCTPETVPEKFVIDLTGLNIGDSIHWTALKAPESVRPVITDRDFTIATIAAPTKMAEVAATAEGGAAAPAAAGKAAAPAAGKAAAPAAKPAAKK